jgi:uncharacterized protein YigE (DUF2233 family)
MKSSLKALLLAAFFSSLSTIFGFGKIKQAEDDRFITYTVDCKKQNIAMYWKDDKDNNFSSIGNLQSWLAKRGRKLVFAVNGGMYGPGHSPKGLFIENGLVQSPLDTSSGAGNFYIKPNGVFYITNGVVPAICDTKNFQTNGKIKYATQSGPMLVIEGAIPATFKQGSTNLNIRNGVGILPDGRVVFAMSKAPVNFYDFANYFKAMGCKNALYLDGFISRTYLPEKNWLQTDGDFGVIIGIVVPN